jgi:putative ABC transport system ATP-binding protein
MMRDVGRTPDRAVIVVTHDTRILQFADRVATMEDGQIVEGVDSSAATPLPR